MANEVEVLPAKAATTEIIPSTEMPEPLGNLVAKAQAIEARVEPLFERAKRIEIKDQESYAEIGAVLTEERGIRKNEIAPLFLPFNAAWQKVRDWLKQHENAVANRCEQIEGIILPKMKAFELAEREAAKKEEAALNKGKKPEERGRVEPSLPSVQGYRKTVNYPIEVTSTEEFVKAFIHAVHRKDRERVKFLAKFLVLDEKALGEHARNLKSPEEFMKQVPGVRCWKD